MEVPLTKEMSSQEKTDERTLNISDFMGNIEDTTSIITKKLESLPLSDLNL
jgi:hypothetical protein